MTMNREYRASEPAREAVAEMPGPVLIEFGTSWCGFCQRAQPLIEAALSDHPSVEYLKIEDGPGKPLGRSFGIKLWPTLVMLLDGHEVARVVRPNEVRAIREALKRGSREAV